MAISAPAYGWRDPVTLPDGRCPHLLSLPDLRKALAPILGEIDHGLGKSELIGAYVKHVDDAKPKEPIWPTP